MKSENSSMNIRVAVFLTCNSNKRSKKETYDWRDDVIKSIIGYFDELIIVSDFYDNKNFKCILPDQLYDTLVELKKHFAYIYVLNDTISAPVFPLEPIFEYLEKPDCITSLCKSYDLYGKEDIQETFYKDVSPLLFMKIPADYPQTNKVIEGTISSNPLLHFYEIQDKSSKYTYFDKISDVIAQKNAEIIIPLAFNMKEYVCDYHFPFVYLEMFFLRRISLIKYGTDRKTKQLLLNLQQIEHFNALQLYEYMISECDIAILKCLLNLNFTFSNTLMVQKTKTNYKTAVFVHLYYENNFEKYLNYLENIPSDLSIYISVNTSEKKEKLDKIISVDLKNHTNIILVQNRGRDVSAFLIGFKSLALNYDRFLFIHDKSAHLAEAFSVGNAFSDCLWENLIGSKHQVENILNFMDMNKHIGILSSPPPYFGVYYDLKSDFWTVCYDKTKALGEKLKLDCSINRDLNPITIGMAFWGQTDALKPLLEYNWQYDDFEEEPMRIDGTISHAIERILPYVAQKQKYLTGWAFSDDFENAYLESHQYMLENILSSILHKNAMNDNIASTAYDLKFNDKCFSIWSLSTIGIKSKFKVLAWAFAMFIKGIAVYIKQKILRNK